MINRQLLLYRDAGGGGAFDQQGLRKAEIRPGSGLDTRFSRIGGPADNRRRKKREGKNCSKKIQPSGWWLRSWPLSLPLQLFAIGVEMERQLIENGKTRWA